MAQTSAVSSPPGSGSHMSSPPGSRPLVSIAPAPQSKPSSVLIQVNQNLPGSQLEDSGAVIQEHEVSDTDKTAIYKHPLFPLLALLFEKCEQASQSAECPSSESFDVDIQSFVHHQEREKRPFLCDDPDLDCLMLKAIQVLRIHLLELEKVTDLCKDFCTRYISCLKGKLQSEKLLHVEGYDGDDMDFSESHEKELDSNANNTPVGAPATPLSLQPGQIVSGGTVYQMVNTPQGLVAQPIQIQSQQVTGSVSVGHVVHGSTPLSQIGIPPTPTSTTHSTATTPSPLTPSTPSASSFFEDEDYEGKNSKTKRGILPKQATNVMRSWLFQHIVHPYPTEDEKRQIAAQTNLTLLQVNNWFINARRRILQPMLDASNPDQIRAKKKTQNRQVQRFWPESIASIQPQTTAAGVAPQPPAGQVVSSASDPSRLIVPVPHGTLISTDGRHILTNTQPVSTTATNQVTMVTESPLLSQAQAVSSSPPITNIEGAGSTHSNDGQPLIKVTDQDFKLTSKEEVQDTHDATDTGAVAD